MVIAISLASSVVEWWWWRSLVVGAVACGWRSELLEVRLDDTFGSRDSDFISDGGPLRGYIMGARNSGSGEIRPAASLGHMVLTSSHQRQESSESDESGSKNWPASCKNTCRRAIVGQDYGAFVGGHKDVTLEPIGITFPAQRNAVIVVHL